MVKTYSKKTDGDKALSESFRVREFACKDGTDKILIDSTLVLYLQRIREWACGPVKINSGYRTPTHNAKVGGSKTSYHLSGQAADIIVPGKSISEVAAFAEYIGIKGIERNEDLNYIHIDTRSNKYFWRRVNSKNISVSTFGGKNPYSEPTRTKLQGDSGTDVNWIQFMLKLWGYSVSIDGRFGPKTEKAVKDVQKKCGLIDDGIVGEKTRRALKGLT